MVNTDCPDHPYYLCENHVCTHKSLLPFYPREIAGFIVLTIIGAINSVAGVGGGGIEISFTMLFFVMTTKEAIGLSSFAIICSCLARYLQTLKWKHPEKDAVVIDYNIATIMMPTVLIGSFIGAFLNVALPVIVIIVCLTGLLWAMAVQSLIKFLQIYRKESAKIRAEKQAEA